MAARRFGWGEFHYFDAGAVGVVGIKAVFSIAADFGAIEGLQPVFAQLDCGSLSVVHAERKMILDAELFVVGVGGDVKHVFDPTAPLADLDFVPIDILVLESSVPVRTETEEIKIEAVFRCEILHNKSSM